MSQSWIFLRCPSCKGKFKLPPSAQGKNAQCPHCEATVGVPAAEAGSEPAENKSRKRKIREERKEKRKKQKNTYKEKPLIPEAESIPEPTLDEDEHFIEEIITLSEDGNEIQSIDFDEQGVEYIREELEDGTVQLRKRRRQAIPEWEKTGTVLDDDPRSKLLLYLAGAVLLIGLMFVLKFAWGASGPETESHVEELKTTPVARDQLFLAKQATENFLKARDWQERALFVRDAERVTPLMRDYYTRNPDQDGPIPYINVGSRDYIEMHKRFVSIFFEREDYDRDIIAVEVSEDGNFKVDWESFVCHSEAPWEDFVANRTTKSTLFRVAVERDDFYDKQFSHPLKWICYKLTFQDSDTVFWGYAKVHSDAHHGLMMGFGKKGIFTLRLKFPENSESDNQVIISETLQKGWVVR